MDGVPRTQTITRRPGTNRSYRGYSTSGINESGTEQSSKHEDLNPTPEIQEPQTKEPGKEPATDTDF